MLSFKVDKHGLIVRAARRKTVLTKKDIEAQMLLFRSASEACTMIYGQMSSNLTCWFEALHHVW